MADYAQTMLQGMQGLASQAMQQRRLQQEMQAAQMQQQIQAENARRQWAAEQRQQQGMQNLESWRDRQAAHQDAVNRRLWEAMQQNAGQANRRLEVMDRNAQLRAAAAERSANERARGTLKPGYAWDPQDPMKQVPIPGGPAWRELSSKHADDLQRLGAFAEIADASKATVERILDPTKKDSGFNPNFGGVNALAAQYMPSVVPGFKETQNVRNDLENLKSNLKAQGASLMRGVGGAPGSITEREWPILEKMIESLSPLMGEKEAEEALRRISQRFEGMKQRSLSNYKREWEDSPFFKGNPLQAPPPGGAGTIPEGVDPKVWKFMTPAEKALWTKP